MSIYNYEIAASGSAATQNIEALTVPVPPPKSDFQPYADLIDLGDASVRGVGYARAEWRWGFLTRAQRDQLRTFCTGASAAVKIRTKIMDSADSYSYFTGVMIWPSLDEERDAGRRPDFVIKFRQLVEYTP